MKKKGLNSLATIIALMILVGASLPVNVVAQKTANRASADVGKMLIADDPIVLEMQRRNEQLSTTEREQVETAMRELSTSLSGTWELVERTVNNKMTGGRTVLVPTSGRMVFDLTARGTSAGGDFTVFEEGLGSLVISEELETGAPFIISSLNQVFFMGGVSATPAESTSSAVPQSRIVISEQLSGEIQGSYGAFRQPMRFSLDSRTLTQYARQTDSEGKVRFVAAGKVPAPSGSTGGGSDNWDIINISDGVMILGISEKGLLDVWRKTSNIVQIKKQPLRLYWEALKRSGRLSQPTFKSK